MGILTGNPKKQPLHYGEVFSIWSFLQASKMNQAKLQTLGNHTGDRDLKNLLDELVQSGKKEIEDLEDVLKENGIAIPPQPPERSYADLESIPAGAKFNDPEISASVSAMLAQGLIACSTVISQSTREDVAMLFGQYHMNKAQAAAKALRLNKEKGCSLSHPFIQTYLIRNSNRLPLNED